MKKIITTAITIFALSNSGLTAQTIVPCNTYQMQEHYKKTIPGYAEKLEAFNQKNDADYAAYQNALNSAAKTSSLSTSYTYTIPVVFHILHTNGSENISDAACAAALAQVNSDYARLGSDTNTIDPLFKSLYVNSHFKFELAKKDPYGNCTNGVVHHYDPNTIWDQDNSTFHYKYSIPQIPGAWLPSKYLNIYIVKGIVGAGIAPGTTVVGYTHLAGTAPSDGADAIVYTSSFLSGTDARSLSHEIGHWFGLSHTFGASNNAGVSCDNDDIFDTPRTTGFFSTCPKLNNLSFTPSVMNLTDSAEIVNVVLGSGATVINSKTLLNSLSNAQLTVPSGTATLGTKTITAKGIAGGYTKFTDSYPLEIANGNTAAVTLPITVKTLAAYNDSNSIGIYVDKNNNGLFTDAGEAVYVPTVAAVGSHTFTSSVIFPAGIATYLRMRIVNNKGVVTSPIMALNSGEVEDYILAVRLNSCDSIRPNIENFMDYSSCPKMFTQGQTNKIRYTAEHSIASRNNLWDTTNLIQVGLYNNPTTLCAPISDFCSNKTITCTGKSVVFYNISYNYSSPITAYSWVFEGGTPATSSVANPTVTYAAQGNYSVSLTVTNANGTSTKSVPAYVYNDWNSNENPTYPYTQDFESGLTDGWQSRNPDFTSIAWQPCNYGSQNTGHSMMLPNFNGGYYNKNIDILESPNYNFHNVSNIAISIDYCAPRKVGVIGASLHSLHFQYSNDCGGTWTNMPADFPSDTVMASYSGVTSTGPYIPWNANEWKTLSQSIAAAFTNITNQRDVRFRVWYQNNYASAQNLYIDQFSITGTVGLEDLASTIGLSIYPNPTSESSVVEFTSPVDSKVTISVNDILGREVENSMLHVNAGIMTKYTVNKSSQLKSGIYFVTVYVGEAKVTKKLIIE